MILEISFNEIHKKSENNLKDLEARHFNKDKNSEFDDVQF